MSTTVVHITFAKIYQYKGWLFEWDRNKPITPWPLKKDFEPKKRAGDVFFKIFSEFNCLPIERQEEFRFY